MTQAANRRNPNTLGQLLLVVLVIVGALVLLYFLGVFSDKPRATRTVTYTVEGSASTAVVTYTQKDGKSTGLIDISVPWHLSLEFSKGTVIILTVGNPTQTGSIDCILLLDGKEWKKKSTKPPDDKVSCAGIVP